MRTRKWITSKPAEGENGNSNFLNVNPKLQKRQKGRGYWGSKKRK